MKTLTKITLSAPLVLATLMFAACSTAIETDVEEDDVVDEEQEQEEQEEEEIDPDEELPLAPFDNDSLQAPAESHFLSPTRKGFTFTNDVSSELGDAADFVEFEVPNNSNSVQRIHSIALDCDFVGDTSAIAHVRIYEDGEPTNEVVRCNEGEDNTVNVDNTRVQTAVVEFSSVAIPTYMSYTLTVQAYR